MITFKSIKKTALFGGILLVTTGLTAFIAVACSNSSNPAITASTSLFFIDGTDTNGQPITRKLTPGSVSFSVEPAVEFGGDKYTSSPSVSGDFSSIKVNDQKAVAYFRNITNFGSWLHGFTLQIQNFLSAAPNNLVNIDPAFAAKVYDLACGLSAPLNDGADTARLGLNAVNFTMDLKASIDKNFKPYNATDDIGKDVENTWKETITGVNLKYNWWTTNSSNAINWQPHNWDVENQNKTLWHNLNSVPKAQYLLELNNVSFDVIQKTVEKDAKWIYDGKTSIVDPAAAFQFYKTNPGDLLTKQQTEDVAKFLRIADQNRRGDILNSSFIGFITSKDQESNLHNFIKIFK